VLLTCGATAHIITDESKFIKFDNTFKPDKHLIELANGTPSNNVTLKRGNVNITIRRRLYTKISRDKHHPLYSILPTVKDSSHMFRRKTSQLPSVTTERFKNCFVNRLCFNYNLAV